MILEFHTRACCRLGLRTLIAAFLFATALLAGCANGPTPSGEAVQEVPVTADTAPLEKMVQQGRYLDAALAYSRLANESPSPLREEYSLRAAELLMQGDYVPQAFQMLNELDGAALGPTFDIRRALLSADIALARQMPQQALTVLDSVAGEIAEDEIDFRRRWHRLRGEAWTQLGEPLKSAREYASLGPLLSDPAAVQANQTTVLDTLSRLSPQALERALRDTPPDEFQGWLALALLGKTERLELDDEALVARWREFYPQHPATDASIQWLLETRPEALRPPEQIALILPLSGRYAKAGEAVRSGFLAAWYDDARRQTGEQDAPAPPRLRLYDEGHDPKQITAIYQQAIEEGADFVVGPLDKAAVHTLAAAGPLPTPVLALNVDDQPLTEPQAARFFQLALSPEQEAREVAERAWLDGHARAVVIAPDSSWGNRVAHDFHARWLTLGGHVVELQHYEPKKNDYSLPIRRLLNVDESQARRRLVSRIIGKSVEFIPRRRQDIDLVFMAAFSRQARVIRPQLRFHHAPRVPVYATSHAFSGHVDKQMDRDMDGVQFLDMPWTLAPDAAGQRLRLQLAQAWPAASERYTRLQALGVDAYRVIASLNTLRHDHDARFPGQTGALSLDMANRLQRRLLWARFQHGVPQLLDDL